MPKIVNFGSLNIDYVYRVHHFLRGGETLAASDRTLHMGGKGLNQTVALNRSGQTVCHVGVLGEDGRALFEFLRNASVQTDFLQISSSGASGHTIIQVTPDGENAILYYPGTNYGLTQTLIDSALETCAPDDIVLVQNEVNLVPDIMQKAKEKGLRVVFNPAPFSDDVLHYPLEAVDALILNETEATEMAQKENATPLELIAELKKRLPHCLIILTTGKKGLIYTDAGVDYRSMPAYKMQAVDTTGAGDTFVGFALRAITHYWQNANRERFEALLDDAVLAAGLSVTKAGAVDSIPTLAEVNAYRLSNH